LVPDLRDIYEKRSTKEQGKAWLVPPYDATAWGVTNQQDIAWMDTRLRPMPWHTHDQPLEIQNIESRNLPKTYIACTDFKDFHFMARRAKSYAREYYSLKTGHEAVVTLPNELASLLQRVSDIQ